MFLVGSEIRERMWKYCILHLVSTIFPKVFYGWLSRLDMWWPWTESQTYQILMTFAQFSRLHQDLMCSQYFQNYVSISRGGATFTVTWVSHQSRCPSASIHSPVPANLLFTIKKNLFRSRLFKIICKLLGGKISAATTFCGCDLHFKVTGGCYV